MPSTMTYNSLVADLEAYLQRHDALVINQIPQFIALAQIRIPREMKILGFRQEVTGTFDGTAQSSGLMAKPSDWRKTIAFYVGTGTGNNTHTGLFERDYDYVRSIYPDPTVQNIPKFYADADYYHWLIQPSPPSALPFKIPYYATLTQLDNTTSTNWLTVNAPDLLLYASLLEAVSFVKTDERIPVWQGLYQNAKTALQAQEMEGKYDTQAVVGEPQMPSLLPR
jgi:hypothetical protein